jgi:Holliday junction DNA helicase RuvB
MRPTTLEEFVSSDYIKNTIKFTAEASKIKGTPFPHTIILGGSGVGKTTLAKVIANMMGCNSYEMFGSAFRIETLFKIIREMKEGDCLILDECHELGSNMLSLYPILEDGEMYLPGLTGRIKIKSITIIAITNEIGMLTQAFIDRFKLKIELDLYSPSDLAKIIKMNTDIVVTDDAALFLSGISKGTPRIAIDFIGQVENYAISKGIKEITVSIMVDALRSYGIDKFGFNHIQRSIIETLGNTYTGQAVGLSTLANLVGKSMKDVANIHEGYLLSQGIIEKRKNGRILTVKGYEILDNLKSEV